MFSRIMLFLFFVKKKYIILYEQCLYNNLHFLYEHHFYPSFFNQEKGEHISINQDIIKQKIFFYEHIFLNIHNVYFYLFQKKKKKRTFSLKIFWRAYHNFKMKFNKEQFINEEENMSKEVEERNNYDINYTSKDGINIFHNNNVRNDNDIGVTKKKDKRQNYTNIFKYSSDWNYNTNVLNIYITDFLNKECIYDEKILMDILSKVCIHSKNEDGSLQLFNYIIIYILINCTTFHIYHDEEKKKNYENFLLLIYNKVLHLYFKLLKEILLKEQTNIYNIEIFIYLLKIIILLLITNNRSSNICKKIYHHKYFFLSHIYCFFFYDNEIIKILSFSLSFYLICDEKILLLYKYRIFLEPYLFISHKNNSNIYKHTNIEQDKKVYMNKQADSHMINIHKLSVVNENSQHFKNSIIEEINVNDLSAYKPYSSHKIEEHIIHTNNKYNEDNKNYKENKYLHDDTYNYKNVNSQMNIIHNLYNMQYVKKTRCNIL